MLASSLQGMPPVPMATATSLPTVQPFTATGKASIYPSFHNHSFLTPFSVQTGTGYSAVPTMPTYNGGCNGTNSSFPHLQTSSYSSVCNGTGSGIPHVPTTSTFSPYYPNHAEVNSHPITGLIQPSAKYSSHSMASQFSPAATDDENDHQGTDVDDCTSPTTSPTGPLLSPDTTLPSSLPNSSISAKMTYNVTANSYTNGYSNTYSSGASTHHYLPSSNLSHTPSTINSPYTQHYTSLPPVASLPATMSNVVMYSPNHAYTHGQPDYNHPLANPAWSHINPQTTFDTPRFKLTPERASPLQKWFDDHKDHPYPTRHDKMMLCRETQLTFTQVSTWFANCRRRLKKANQEEEERNNYSSSNGYSGNSYSEESSPQRRSRSPRSHSPCSRKHDSDEKPNNYDCVTPTAQGDNLTVGCKYPKKDHHTNVHASPEH